jgi:hypothetical protein
VAEEEEEEGQGPRVRTVKKQSEMLFVRGMAITYKGIKNHMLTVSPQVTR